MRLYRIRRKSDGKFFYGLRYPWSEEYGCEGWSDSGAFYCDIDTIVAWIRVLCSNWKANRHKMRSHCWSARRFSAAIDMIYPENLSLYEVVINNVTIMGEEVIKAEDIINQKEAES